MLVTLRFENVDAAGDDGQAVVVEMQVNREAVPHIMDWYGAFYSGDEYTVSINGRKQAKGINGEFETPTIDAERHMTREEQQIMHAALRRSVKIIHKA